MIFGPAKANFHQKVVPIENEKDVLNKKIKEK